MQIKPSAKFIFSYLILFYLFSALAALALLFYKQANFSQERLREMIVTPSSLRDSTDNPCRYTIHGDPLEAGSSFVKINFVCQDGQKTVSTLSLKALPDAKLSTILSEYSRILGFKYALLDQWDCLVEDHPVSDRNFVVADKSQIVCLHPDAKI